MKTKILAAVILLAGIAFQSCLGNGDDTVVLESSGVKKPNPDPEPNPNPNPDPNPNPEPEEDDTSINEGHYFDINNSQFREGSVPHGSCGDFFYVNMNSMVLAGGTNWITIGSYVKYDKFYIGIEGVNGYYEYSPDVDEEFLGVDGYEYWYSIPLKYTMEFQRNINIMISAGNADCVSGIYTQEITFVKSQDGALNVVLTFDNAKDIDLLVVTPSGRMIYFGDPGGFFNLEDGSSVFLGLDHDSNAGCSADGLNNENVVISEEVVEPGDYYVYVNLFSNCDATIATNWTCTVRYKGVLLENKVGVNPATGTFAVGAASNEDKIDLDNPVFVFSVPRSKAAKAGAGKIDLQKSGPSQPSRAELQKIAARKK